MKDLNKCKKMFDIISKVFFFLFSFPTFPSVIVDVSILVDLKSLLPDTGSPFAFSYFNTNAIYDYFSYSSLVLLCDTMDSWLDLIMALNVYSCF